MKTKTINLYRNCLRYSRKWPEDIKDTTATQENKNRSLRQHFLERVRSEFSANKGLKDVRSIEKLHFKAERQLTAVKNLLEDKYDNEFGKIRRPVPPEVEKADELLSNKNQAKIAKGKWSLWDRLGWGKKT